MLRDITIGQYYPADSVIHRLDPRTKLMGVLIYVVSLFVFRGLAGLAAVTAALAFVIWLSKVPFGYMVRGLKAIVIILVITVLFNLFLTPGEPLVEFFGLKITWEGLEHAAFMTVRLTYLILGSSLLTLTTTPNQLTDGMERALKRANDLAMAMEARCYRGGDGRTKMKPLKYKRADVFSYLLIGGYFAVVILLRAYL